jgi:hypothetical protein
VTRRVNRADQRRAASLVAVLVLFATAVSCGVPTSGSVQTVEPANVPFGLGEPRPSPARLPEPTLGTRLGPGWYFIRRGHLVYGGASTTSGSAIAQLVQILGALSDGPTADQQTRGTGTAIPAGMIIRLVSLADRTARIEITGESARPDVVQNALVVGQIVLSATSVPGVDGVLLARGGQAVPAALPDGTLAEGIVRARAFESLVASGTPTPGVT